MQQLQILFKPVLILELIFLVELAAAMEANNLQFQIFTGKVDK
jgi:hypothetical protein